MFQAVPKTMTIPSIRSKLILGGIGIHVDPCGVRSIGETLSHSETIPTTVSRPRGNS